MPLLTYSVSDFQAFTKIRSADVNARFSDIATLLNTTGLDDVNIQDDGITRATKLKAGTADAVVINDGSGDMSDEAQLAPVRGGTGQDFSTLTGQAGKAITVNSGETAFELATPQVGTLDLAFFSDISTFTSAETIAVRDAVANILEPGTATTKEYRLVQSDLDSSFRDRNNTHLGIATTVSGSITPQISTLTKSVSWTTGTVTITVNGRGYSQAFTTDNDTSMAALASQLAGDSVIQSAVVTDNGSNDNVITVTSVGGFKMELSDSQSGGAPDFTIAETQASAGQNVTLRAWGQLGGFSSLTEGAVYYVSSTAGSITTMFSTGAKKVGQALTDTILFVNQDADNYQFGEVSAMQKSHGASTVGDNTTSGTNTLESFNFGAWSTGTNATQSRYGLSYGQTEYGGSHFAIGGKDTDGTTLLAVVESWDGTSWTTETALPAARIGGGTSLGVSNELTYAGGTTNSDNSGATAAIYTWTGASWATEGATLGVARNMVGGYGTTGTGTAYFSNGADGSNNEQDTTDDWNGGSISSGTAPGRSTASGGEAIPGAAFQSTSNASVLFGMNSTTADAKVWNGASWGSDVSLGTSINSLAIATGDPQAGAGSYDGSAISYVNGGDRGSGASAVTSSFNESSFSASVSSNTSRAGAGASTI